MSDLDPNHFYKERSAFGFGDWILRVGWGLIVVANIGLALRDAWHHKTGSMVGDLVTAGIFATLIGVNEAINRRVKH